MAAPELTRRPIKSRGTRLARILAGSLTRAGVSPNAISLASVVFAGLAGVCLFLAGRKGLGWSGSWLLVVACCGIQLRLLCNLLDGMVAVEGGLGTKAGELFNELPDRFSDTFILIAAGYYSAEFRWSHELGWIASILALMTAYVRALGASLGAGQHFVGPMAKQQRMAILTGACLLAALAPCCPPLASLVPWALAVIVVGAGVTVWRRCARIAAALEAT